MRQDIARALGRGAGQQEWSHTGTALRLLALLHTGRRWTVAELTSRLGVAPRTVRRDVARLRTLGYDVQSHPGPGGAYALAPSIKIPPLLMDADEVCALVTGLLLLEAGHADDSATIVRTKLEQLLPPSLRQRAIATAAATQVLTATHSVHWPALGMIADTIAAGQHLGFAYTDQLGRVNNRSSSPTARCCATASGTSLPTTRSVTTGVSSASTGSTTLCPAHQHQDTRHTSSLVSPSSTGSTATLAALHNTPTDVLGCTGRVRQTTPWSWIRQAPFGPVLSSR